MVQRGPVRPDENELHSTSSFFFVHHMIFWSIVVANATVSILAPYAKKINGHEKGVASSTGAATVQSGYSNCQARYFVGLFTSLFLFWLQILMFDIVEVKYNGDWTFSPPHGPLTWNSYTRAFLVPWTMSIGVMMATHVWFRRSVMTHLLRPVQLREAEFVLLTEVLQDDGPEEVRQGPGPDGGVEQELKEVVRRATLHEELPYFTHRLLRYTFHEQSSCYRSPPPWMESRGCNLRRMFRERQALGEPAAIAAATGEETEDSEGVDYSTLGTTAWRLQQQALHGPNTIEVEVPRFFASLKKECLSLFNLYQYFSLWLMLYWDYISVALLTGMLVMSSIIVKVSAERRALEELRRLARLQCNLEVLGTHNMWSTQSSSSLVPGEVVILSEGEVPCDVVLVQGYGIVDESLLTGEAMPVTKSEVPDDGVPRPRSQVEFRKHYLFAGTRILEARGMQARGVTGIACIVVATGGSTVRGEMMQSLLSDKRRKLWLERQVQQVLIGLIIVGMAGACTLTVRYGWELGPVLSGLFMIIGLVNPLLSVAIIGGPLASAARLKRMQEIHCRELRRLAVAGAVDTVLLDKTGTITEQGLELIGGVPPSGIGPGNRASVLKFWESKMATGNSGKHMREHEMRDLHIALALTHAVKVNFKQLPGTFLQLPERKRENGDSSTNGNTPTSDGQLIGQELEQQMVRSAQSSGWKYDWTAQPDIKADHPALGSFKVVRSFEFSHESMTMSILCRDAEGELHVFCKGSAESLGHRLRRKAPMLELAQKQLARDGCYIISCGHRVLKKDMEPKDLRRVDVECDLEPIGALVFRNKLKEDTTEHIATLRSGGMAIRVVTGDNVLTAVNVARSCGIIPKEHEVWIGDADDAGNIHWRNSQSDVEMQLTQVPQPATLAVTGSGWEALQEANGQGAQLARLLRPYGKMQGEAAEIGFDPEQLGLVIRVFARMTPTHKVSVVEKLQAIGATVGFCGDGGNDSSALRAAHTGLALCGKAEASVAAPCCTTSGSLEALVRFIAEGRASLCTSIAAYRFLVTKGLIFCVGRGLLLFTWGGYLAPLAYLYLDLLVVPYFLWAITETLPRYDGLAPSAPERSVLSGRTLLAPLLCVVVDTLFLVIALRTMAAQDWYIPFNADHVTDGSVPIYEWQHRADNYEAEVTFLWMAWCAVDVALIVSYGGEHREPLLYNKPVVIGAVVCHILQFAILFSSNWSVGCAFKVNCSERVYEQMHDAMINNFLFPYERVGGPYFAPEGDNFLESFFKLDLLVLLILTSVANHGVHFIMDGTYPWEWTTKRKPIPSGEKVKLLGPTSTPGLGAAAAAMSSSPSAPQVYGHSRVHGDEED